VRLGTAVVTSGSILFIEVVRLRKWFRRVAVALLIVIVISWLALYGTSLYHRRKAARLLNELQALSPSTSAADISNLLHRYRWQPNHECTPKSCAYTAVVENLGPFRILDRSTLWDYFGMRPWAVSASISTKNGKFSSAEYWADVGRGRGDLAHVGLLGRAIWAHVGASSMISDSYLAMRQTINRKRGVSDAKDYMVTKPCWDTYGWGDLLSVATSSTPTQAAREFAFDVDLSCTTAFKPCTELCQLRPEAWKELMAQGAGGCNMDEEALARARRACGDWAGRVGNAGKLTTGN
jgi:disulfide bond formation protein DsbB